jgi:putative nucleotidyltransferase with HDIG domain
MDRNTSEPTAFREDCRSRLAAIVSEGLAPLPDCVFDLDVLLGEPVVDLKKVAGALRFDIELGQRVLRLSNASVASPREAVNNIPDAVVLLGPCLFHAAVLISAVSEFGPREFRDENAETMWTHSVLMAALSEKIAELSEYPDRGMAFVAGLLHDIGHLPFLTVTREARMAGQTAADVSWRDNVEMERDLFGLDHCEIGKWMGATWKFSPVLLDAVQHHHEPERAREDIHIAEVVCAAEHFCSGSGASQMPAAIGEAADLLIQNHPLETVRGRGNRASRPSFVWPAQAREERRPGKRFRN